MEPISDEALAELKGRFWRFIDGEVFPAEAALAGEDDAARRALDDLKPGE